MIRNNYILALDIGSSKIAACLTEIRRGNIANIFLESAPSRGIKRGVIVDSIDLVNAIGKTLKNLKAKSGINIKYVYANISGPDIIARRSSAVIPLADRGNKVITRADVQKANEQARILGSNLQEEIIYELPSSYTVDAKGNIANPIGLYSHKLEVDLLLLYGKTSFVQNLSRIINQAGYEVKDILFSGLATSEAVFDNELRDGVSILCDIGSDITELLLFKDGRLKNIEVIPLGGDDLTLQISETLRIPLDLAEDIKRSYANVGDYSPGSTDKEILVKKNDVYKPIKQKLVSEIVTAKTRSICQSVKDTAGRLVPSDKVDYFVACGRTVLLEGFLESLENTLGISVRLGRIVNPDVAPFVARDSAMSGQKYLTYVTALGLVCHVLNKQRTQGLFSPHASRSALHKIINKFKEIYQEYF